MFFVYETLLGKELRRTYWGVLGVDGRFILKLKLKELVVRLLAESLWIVMLVADRRCDRVSEHMFCVSSERFDQLRDCASVTQCCELCSVVASTAYMTVLLNVQFFCCCYTVLSCKLMQLF